jgi:hypothetical protein
VQIVHIFHLQALEHFEPEFLRQFRPADWSLWKIFKSSNFELQINLLEFTLDDMSSFFFFVDDKNSWLIAESAKFSETQITVDLLTNKI